MTDSNDKDRAAVARYYAIVADGYDAIVEDEERTEDLEDVADGVAGLVEGMTVLELACGTGRWTEILADVADHVIAVDINAEMLALAGDRGLDEDLVTFVQADALDLPADLVPDGVAPVKAVFIGFWWSHLTRAHQDQLVAGLRARLGKDVLLIVLDDNQVEGVSPPIARTDAVGNTWHFVTAPDGERFELPKNYPTDSSLKKRMSAVAREVRVARWDTVWVLTCRLK